MKKRRQTKGQQIIGFDLGSTALRVAVGQFLQSDESISRLQLLAAVEVPSQGIHKGVVVSIDEAVSALSHAVEETERLTGVPIDHAWIGLSGSQILSQQSRGIVAVAKPDGEISEDDVARAVDAARMVAPPLNYEILHILPKQYTVDGQTGIQDPLGMTGLRLEVDAEIIYALTTHIKHVTKAVYRSGMEIDDLVLAVLAAGACMTTQRQKELGVAVVNIGGGTTSLVVYEEGDVLHTAVLPIGSEHITNDLAIGLRTGIDVAEAIKRSVGHCTARMIPKRDRIALSSFGSETDEEVSVKYVAEIIEARATEILERVDEELGKIGKRGLLPAGILFCGGGAKISGLVELAKELLGLPASIGYPPGIQGVSKTITDPAFATAIGLVQWGANLSAESDRRPSSPFRSMGKVFDAIRSFWRSLLP